MHIKMSRVGVLFATCFMSFLLLATVLPSCQLFQETPTQEQQAELAQWKQTAAEFTAEASKLRQDLILINDPAQRASIEKRLDEIEPIISALNTAIQNAQTPADVGWGVLEWGAATAAIFFPPAAIAVPLLRSLRRLKNVVVPAIFNSVKAGGGPAHPDAAKPVLAAVPEAKALFDTWKANGPTP